jgi:hypothetical protein
MDKLFMPNETPEERLRILESQATTVTKDTYFVRIEEEELVNARAAFTKNQLAMDDINEQKKDAMSEFKEQLKPHMEIHQELSSQIRKGFREQEGKLFGFLDGNMMYFYDTKGELIETLTRPATTDELQNPTIHMVIKDGTND